MAIEVASTPKCQTRTLRTDRYLDVFFLTPATTVYPSRLALMLCSSASSPAAPDVALSSSHSVYVERTTIDAAVRRIVGDEAGTAK